MERQAWQWGAHIGTLPAQGLTTSNTPLLGAAFLLADSTSDIETSTRAIKHEEFDRGARG
jgi:hypothetical protein